MKVKKYAAIDVGSNAIRLLIMNIIERKGEEPLFTKNAIIRAPIRLGSDSFVVGEISPKKKKRMIDSIKAFQLLMKVHNVDRYLAYATSALREANNGLQVTAEIQKKTGINIEIIDGHREAEIIASTDLYKVVKPDQNYLFVDVGGGSTELTVYSQGQIVVSKSFKIGTVRLLKKMVDKSVWNSYKRWIIKHTSGYEQMSVLGSGGTINSLFKLSGNGAGVPLSYDFVKERYKTFQSMSPKQMMVDFSFNADRADVIEQAIRIYLMGMKHSNSSQIHVPKVGLADGMVKMLYKDKG
ncbi:MAG: rod shape-determining protein [Flavobacteriaceae bacterium]|nr:rod shape-determining protein [Flavobacteriaceae bacterium]